MKISDLFGRLSDEIRNTGNERTSECYQTTLRSILSFTHGRSLKLQEVFCPEFLHRYQEFLLCKGRKRNTVSFYMCILRASFNQAVGQQFIEYIPGLFNNVFTGCDPTPKRAASTATLRTLIEAELSAFPAIERCRDYFILSLYLQGMSFIDMAYLRKCDFQGDTIVYRRHKTGGLICVSVLNEAKTILDKYACSVRNSPYILPVISETGTEGYRQYKNALRNHNRQLKKLAHLLRIDENLSSYVARHSWATIAHHNGVDVSVVSQGMGHQTEEITRIYLSSFNQNELTRANKIVLYSILTCNGEENKDNNNPASNNFYQENRMVQHTISSINVRHPEGDGQGKAEPDKMWLNPSSV